MSFKSYGTALLLSVLLTACGQNYQEQKDQIADEQKLPSPQKERLDTTGSSQLLSSSEKHDYADWDKKIIRTGSLQIEVKDYKNFAQKLNDLVKRNGGYISGEQEEQLYDRISNRVVIKVPVDRFSDVVAALSNLDEKLSGKRISSEDVTTELVDTKARIEAKKKIRQRYMDLLQEAKNMEEILKVQNEINSIQEQIEMAEGRVAYLSHASALSTIELTYFQLLTDNPQPKPAFYESVADAFGNGLQVLKSMVLVLIAVWPLWVVALLGWIFYKRSKIIRVKTVQ